MQEESPEKTSEQEILEDQEGIGQEEEETCGFCIFMKGGGCKDAFEVCLESSFKQKHKCVCKRRKI